MSIHFVHALILFVFTTAFFWGEAVLAVVHIGHEIFCFNDAAALLDGVKDI